LPRDGSNIYHRPPGTDAVTDTTIESTKYNANVADVEQDLNTPRPIVAGGTGATTGPAALIALGGEQAKQVITNFDSATFVPGSFYAAAGATSAPVAGHAFAGIAYYADATNMVIQARDITDPAHLVYTRIMSGGVWGTFGTEGYVQKAGDTMTGPLTVNGVITGTTNVLSDGYYVSTITPTTGSYYFGNSGTKYLSYDGTNFTLNGGTLNVGNVDSSGYYVSSITPTTGSYYFGSSGTKYLNYDGTNFNFLGAGLTVSGTITGNANILSNGYYVSVITPTTGTYYFGNTSTKYLNYDGTKFNLVGGQFYATAPGVHGFGDDATNTQVAIKGGNSGGVFSVQSAGAIVSAVGNELGIVGTGSFSKTTLYSSTNAFRFYGLSAGTMTTDAAGNVVISSDERLKNIEGFFMRGLADLKNIKPILYKWTDKSGYDTEAVYAGVSAQNVQASIPEAIGQNSDGLLSISDCPLIAALINAVNELAVKVMALEAMRR
jgi:hypothetical protein